MDESLPLRSQRAVPTSPRTQFQGHISAAECVTTLNGDNRVQRRIEWRKTLTLSLDRKRPARDEPDDPDESILPPISRLSGPPSDTGDAVKTKPDPPRVHGSTNGHTRHHHTTFRPPQQCEAAVQKVHSKLQSNPNWMTRDVTKPNLVSPRSYLGHVSHRSPPTFDWRDARNRIAWSPERNTRSELNKSFPELSKHKPKHKVMKFLAEDSSVHLSPSRDRIGISPALGRVTPNGHLKESRSPAVKNNVKHKSFSEPFSIRSKIEQFRKWHEDQFMEKLTRLKLEAGRGFHEPLLHSLHVPGTDFPKIVETSFVDNNPEVIPPVEYAQSSQHILLTDTQNPPVDSPAGVEVIESGVDSDTHVNLENGAGSIASSAQSRARRPVTSVTWRTWRDVNASDAYCDVEKYIRDNGLMDKEREQWIRQWITNVQSAMALMEDATQDVSDYSL